MDAWIKLLEVPEALLNPQPKNKKFDRIFINTKLKALAEDKTIYM